MITNQIKHLKPAAMVHNCEKCDSQAVKLKDIGVLFMSEDTLMDQGFICGN